MSAELISLDTFKILTESQNAVIKSVVDAQKKIVESLSQEMKVIATEQAETTKELKETNSLLRADINTTKAILHQHIKEYNNDQQEVKKRFVEVFTHQNKISETLEAQESVVVFGKYLKRAVAILLIGGLTATGAHWANQYFTKTQATTEIKKPK